MNRQDPVAEWEGVAVAELQRRWRIPMLVVRTNTSSTNDDATRLAIQGAPAGTTVIADSQISGRGRRGRVWTDAPMRSVLLSIVFRSGHQDGSVMPLRIGLAAVRALRAATRIDARIKWPNDIVLENGAKIGGILCEASTAGESASLIAGIGVNVLQTGPELDSGLLVHASSVALAGGVPDRLAIVGALLDQLRPFHVLAPPLRPDELDELDRLHVLGGRPITIDGRPAGLARRIAPDGSLEVDTGGLPLSLRTGTVRIDAGPAAATRAPGPHAEIRAEPAP